MKYGSVCSGVEAASLAWEPLGFKPVFFSEIEKFPSAVLKHHWPQIPNLVDEIYNFIVNFWTNKGIPFDDVVNGKITTIKKPERFTEMNNELTELLINRFSLPLELLDKLRDSK